MDFYSVRYKKEYTIRRKWINPDRELIVIANDLQDAEQKVKSFVELHTNDNQKIVLTSKINVCLGVVIQIGAYDTIVSTV